MPKTLEEVLTGFEKEDTKKTLRSIIEHAPSLKADLEKAGKEDNLVEIRYADLRSSNGTYDYESKTLTLNRALKAGLDRGDTDTIIALALVAGHEGSHATRGNISFAHTEQIKREVSQVHGQGAGVRDYTQVAQRHVDYIINEEAKAEIGGFNAAVAAAKWKERHDDFSEALQSLTNKNPQTSGSDGPAALALGQFSNYVEGVQGKFGYDYQLKGGVQPSAQEMLDPASAGHLAFMRTHFSDRVIDDDASKDRYYRHTAVADVVRFAIDQGAKHTDIGLNMDALGVRRAGFADKFHGLNGQVVNVNFTDLKPALMLSSPMPSQLQPQSIALSQQELPPKVSGAMEPVASSGRKREYEGVDESIKPIGEGSKAQKLELNPVLFGQARTCLKLQENESVIAAKGLSNYNERICCATAVAAQNNGLPQIKDVRINNGEIWVSSAPRGADHGQNVSAGQIGDCAKKTEQQHLANLRVLSTPDSSSPNVTPSHQSLSQK
jgi:hypothetical protein